MMFMACMGRGGKPEEKLSLSLSSESIGYSRSKKKNSFWSSEKE